MKLLLIDNETHIRRGLRDLILAVSEERPQIEEADGVQTGLRAIRDFAPDVVLLDIEMEDGTGFDLLRQLPSVPFQLIFTTAFDQYAIQAFKFSAIDYLMKPIDPDELRHSLERAAANLRSRDLQAQITVMMSELANKKEDRRIVLRDIDSTYFVRVQDILFCQAEGTYTRFFFADSPAILVSKNLKEYELLLEPLGFIRTHHSFLANPSKVRIFDKTDGGSLILEGNHRIPLSQRKRDHVLCSLEKKN